MMDIPSRVPTIISFSPSVSITEISSSSSRRFTARRPFCRMLEYSLNGVFFMIPPRVTITRLEFFPASDDSIGNTADTFSSGSRLNMFTMAVPFAVLPASGI